MAGCHLLQAASTSDCANTSNQPHHRHDAVAFLQSCEMHSQSEVKAERRAKLGGFPAPCAVQPFESVVAPLGSVFLRRRDQPLQLFSS